MRGSGRFLTRAPAIAAVRRKLGSAALALRGGTRLRIARADRNLAPFETWPAWVFYAPVAGYVVWNGLRHRGISVPAAANPPASADGVLNVSKSRLFGAMGPAGRRWLPSWVVLERAPSAAVASVASWGIAAMEERGFGFPVVAKPDRGGGGAGVGVVRSERDLQDYVARFPAGRSFLLQELIPFEQEAGVMYVRRPGEREGRVVSLALKESPVAVGDGATPLWQLIERHPRAPHLREFALRTHRDQLERIPARGERIELIFARNHCRGAVFRDGTDLVTPSLARRIDRIARSIPSFHVGRLDIRFASPSALQRGEDFRIIEINGVASEPIHAWDPGNSVGRAWRTYFEQIDLIYEVGAANRALGYRQPELSALLAGWWRQRRVTQTYPDG